MAETFFIFVYINLLIILNIQKLNTVNFNIWELFVFAAAMKSHQRAVMKQRLTPVATKISLKTARLPRNHFTQASELVRYQLNGKHFLIKTVHAFFREMVWSVVKFARYNCKIMYVIFIFNILTFAKNGASNLIVSKPCT